MILELVKRKAPVGRLEIRTWEIIEVYMGQINRDRCGDTYAPGQLARYITNLTNYTEFYDQLKFDWNDTRLVIYFSSDLETPLCEIRWKPD